MPSVKFVGVGLLSAAFLFFAPQARAAIVAPALIDVEADRVEIVPGAIIIRNNEGSGRIYDIEVQNFVSRGEDGRQTFLDEETPSGLATWIVPNATSVTLAPGDERAVAYSISIPENAEPGGHYAALFFSSRIPEQDEGGAVGAVSRIGVLFLVRVSGDIREDASIESFQAMTDGGRFHLPVYFETRIRNTGNVHIRPAGDIVMTNMFGRETERISFNPTDAAVLPGGVRKLTGAWGNGGAGTEGRSFIENLKAELRDFAIGRYTAEVRGTYGKSGQDFSARQSFWLFPWRVAAVFAFGLLFILVLIRGYNRAIVRAAFKRRGRE